MIFHKILWVIMVVKDFNHEQWKREDTFVPDLAAIFDPFHRVGGSKEAGSGLGLAITKKIVERHGGDIRAFNSPEGLEIRIRLPANS